MLIRCPSCNLTISDQALNCPKCGRPLKDVHRGNKGNKTQSGCWIYFLLGFGVLWFVFSQEAKQEDEAKEEYLRSHPLTEHQQAANKHFNTCYQYCHKSAYVWSERQKYYSLLGEGCYSDDRDDPRYPDATYPWNANAPRPWISPNK
jgi:hypothetical protein